MNTERHPISTFPRFLYLNFYAFLLFALGGGVIAVAAFWTNCPVFVGSGIVAFICFRYGVKIFASWSDKKRKYTLLVTRNADTLRPDTFREFLEAPCGRLLVRVVLSDLCQENALGVIMSERVPFKSRFHRLCSFKRERTVVHMFNK